MSLSGQKTTQKVNQTETTSGTTTPTNPQWTTDAIQGLLGRINSFGDTDPASYVAGNNPLLQSVFNRAGSLSGWNGQPAMDLAQQAGNAGPNLAGAPSLVTGQGYGAPQLGSAQGYDAPTLGAAIRAAVQGYDPATVGRVSIGATPGAVASDARATDARATDARAQSLLTSLSRYMSPYTNDVVSTTLAGFDDNAERVRAAQAAEAARNRSFGGSRYSIQAAQTEANIARERAASEAGLRDRAFGVGAGLSADDANRRQQVSIGNADRRTGVSVGNADRRTGVDVGNADRRTGVSTFNAGQELQRALAQAGFDFQGNIFNSTAANDSRSYLARAMNDAALAQTGQQTQRDIAGAGLAADARRFGAQGSRDFALAQAGFDADAAKYGADITNRSREINANFLNDTSRFNATQGDTALARQLQAAGLMGNLAGQQSDDARATLGLQGNLGLQAQALDQARAEAPMSQIELLSQLYSNLPFNLFTGQQVNSAGKVDGTTVTKEKKGLGNMLLDAATAAAMAYAGRSDRRLKTNIERLGEFADGLGIYRFSYKVAPAFRFVGVMADEVAKLRPWALGPETPDGFATVAYGRL